MMPPNPVNGPFVPTRTNLEVSGHFEVDAVDYLDLFRRTREAYEAVAWRRAKNFTFLRLSYECALKAVVAYFNETPCSATKLAEIIRKTHGHDIEVLEGKARPHIASLNLPDFGKVMKDLPVHLRYRVEAWPRWNGRDTDVYNTTVRSDSWLNSLEAAAESVAKWIKGLLSEHEKPLDGDDIRDLLQG